MQRQYSEVYTSAQDSSIDTDDMLNRLGEPREPSYRMPSNLDFSRRPPPQPKIGPKGNLIDVKCTQTDVYAEPAPKTIQT